MDAQTEAINRALLILGEHFDHVEILASVEEDGQSIFVHKGRGNWYARQGMAHQFINIDNAQTMGYEIKQLIPQADGGDDEQEV